MEDPKEKSVALIQAITSPLGFFALCLLIVEGFLSITLIFSNLTSKDKFIGMIIGAVLFLFVLCIVGLLVWKKPENLTFGEGGHLRRRQLEQEYGSTDSPSTAVVNEDRGDLTQPSMPN